MIVSARQYRVFGSGNFAGNPTTIHQLTAFPDDATLLAHSQSLVTVDNAYYQQAAETGHFHVKCCSHTALVNVCGHALLATGHHLLATTDEHELKLNTPAFAHLCKRAGTTSELLSLPRYTARQLGDSALVDKLLRATGLANQEVAAVLAFPFQVYALITTSPTALQSFQPTASAWETLNDLQPGALLLSCAIADGSYAFRYFSPWWGKPEDTATGSAHSYLAPYWLQDGAQVETLQLSPAGPARAQVQLDRERVWIGGQVAPVSDRSLPECGPA